MNIAENNMTETITIQGHEYQRMYCLCGYEYKVRDNDSVDDFLYEIDYHRAVHACSAEWDFGGVDYYQSLGIGWRKLDRSQG